MVEPTDGDGEIDLVGVASAGAEGRSPLVGELQNDAKYKRDSNRKSAHNQDGIMKSWKSISGVFFMVALDFFNEPRVLSNLLEQSSPKA